LKTFDRSQRALRLSAALFVLLLAALPAHARGKSEAWARTQFTSAERMREALNGRPATERTRREYQRVISAYRRVYYGAPASSKADASVVAVAELLVETGRQSEDDSTLRSAIGQYEFLRREYPGSKYRFDALFTIGEIYQEDLDDPIRAHAVFEEFLRRYPHNHLAEEARKALIGPVQQASLKSKIEDGEESDDSIKDTSSKQASAKDSSAKEASDDQATVAASKAAKLPRVTGIRHWSTPDYTRVAIDLEQDIKYESQRIDRPDRIVFDLLDSKLSSTLVGKTFDVDDGFLKKIRVAQFQPGKTRVVLEVDDLSDYNAFLLPNPSRLIIDIHGKDVHTKNLLARNVQGKENQGKPAAKEAQTSSQVRDDGTATTKVPSEDKTPAVAPPAIASKRDPTLQPKAESKTSFPSPAISSSSTAPRKKIVEVDDEADDAVTKPQPPSIKPISKTTTTPAPAPTPSVEASSDSDSLPSIPSKTSSPATTSRAAKGKHKSTTAGTPGREAIPTASGDRSLIRALGLKIGRIVIDPGHGGHDAGTIGPHGLEEKDLVLDVGRRLGKLLETRMGAEVVYTRKDDTFVPLETRTAIANQEQADLFVSIHANSSRDRDARGVETYYLNFTSSREALDVAARENAVSEESIHELQDLVKKIALKEKIDESREFAADVQRSLHSGLAAKSPGVRDRGVKKAPFIVLIGANMPSILAEISFVSNPGDERRLGTAEYRQRIAESLYRGIAKYVSGLSGVKVASKLDKNAGQ
jgi:N-acetylmuramoyl-L-alanine amidase